MVATVCKMALSQSKTPSAVVRDERLGKGMTVPGSRLGGAKGAGFATERTANDTAVRREALQNMTRAGDARVKSMNGGERPRVAW